MKKTLSLMMALAVVGTMAAPAMAANDEPMVIAPAPNAQSQQAQMKIVVKGKTMPVQTISVNGCTMAPVRAIAEALGFKVTWNAPSTSTTVKCSPTCTSVKTVTLFTPLLTVWQA